MNDGGGWGCAKRPIIPDECDPRSYIDGYYEGARVIATLGGATALFCFIIGLVLGAVVL